MSHRRKSACCCDGKQGPCFLGYGTVPKTDYIRRYIPGVFDGCGLGDDGAGPIQDAFTEKSECNRNAYDNWAFCDPTKEEELVLFIERPATAWSTLCATQTPNPCVECVPHPDCVDVGEGFTDDDPGGGQGGGDGGEQCCEECPGEFCSDTCTGDVSCREGCDIGPFSFNIVSEEMEPIVVRYRHPTGVSDSLNIVNELASPLPDRAKEELYQWSFKSANNVLPWPAGGPPPWTGNLYPLNGEGRVGSLGGDRQYQIHDHGNMDHGLPCYSKYNGTQRLSECGNGYDCICSQGYFWACYLDPEYVSNSGNVPFKFFGSTGLPSSKGVAHIIGDTWRTSDYGWIPGRDHDAGCYSCDPDECGDCENCGKTKVQLGPGELGGSYFWLQGIADAPKDHWYANFKPVIGGQYAFDPGPGPQGTSRLAETLLCVVHREKYYERYYTSIKQDDDPRAAGPGGVPEQNPGADFGDYEEYFPDTTIDNGQGNPLGHWWQGDEESAPGSSNAWINNRTPKYFLLGCAGCPIFTWEIALNDTLNSTEWRTLDYGSSLDDALDSIESNPVSIADLCLLIMNGLPTYGKLNLNDEPKGYLSPGLIAVLQEEGILPDAQNYGEEQDFKIFKKKMKRIDVDWDGDLGMCCLSGPVSTGNCLEVHPEGGCNISSCGGSPDATDTGGEITGEVCSQNSGNYPCCLDLGVYYEFDTDPVTGNREYIEVASQPTGNEGVDWAQGWGWDQDCVTIAEGLVGSIESPGECGQEETFCLDQTVREECRWFGGQWHGPAIPGADPPMCEIEGVEGYCIGTNAEKAGNLKGSCCKRCMDGSLFDCDDKPDCCDGRDLVTCRCAETTFQVDRDGDFSLIETCGGIDVGDEDGDPSEHGNGAGFYKWSPNKNCWNSNGFETCGPPGEFGAQCELRGPATDAEFPDFIIEEDQYFYGRPGGWAHMCSIPNPSENYAFPQVDRFRQSDGESCFTAAPIPQYTSCLDTSPCNGCNGNTDEYEACMKDHCCILAQCAVCGDGVGGNLCSSEGISETCRGAWFTYQQTVLEDGNEYNCKIHNNAWLLRVDPWLQFDSTKGPDAEEDDQVEIWKGLPGWIPTRHYDDDPHYQDDEISWYHRPFTITVPVACRENDFQFNDECCGAQCTRTVDSADGSEITCPKRGARQGIDEEEPEGDELPCVFNCKPSSGSGLPDPACGRVCPEDYYCCPYTGQCMPYSTNSPVDPPCYPCAQPCPEEQNCCVIPDPDGFPGYEAHCITGLCPQYDIPLQLPQENIEWQGVAIPGQTVRVIPGIVGGSAPYTVSYTFKVNDVITSVVEGDGAGAEYEITLDDVTDPIEGEPPEYADDHGTFTALRAHIAATPDGGILDLAGLRYGATPSDFAKITILKNMTITNGTISGSMFLDWLPSGNRVTGSRFDAIAANYDDPTAWLMDEGAADYPVLSVWPAPAAQSAKYPLTYNGGSWVAMRGINDPDGPTNMGDVNTTLGDNNRFGIITGFTITNDTLKAQLDARFTSLDTTVDNLSIFMHAGPNVVGYAKIQSWDEPTGVCVFVPGSNNSALKHASSDYFQFILMGDSSFITGDGQYVIDQAAEAVVYQPAGGSGIRARLALATEMIRTGSQYNVTFDSLTLTGNRGGEYWLVAQAANPNKIGRLTMTNCDIRFGCAGLTSYATVQDSNFRQMQYRGVAGPDGMIVERCLFDDILNKSAIAVLCRSSADTSDIPVELSIIRDCKISLPSAVHGQGVSLYNSSWQNATIEHNIFLNCDRSLSFQPEGTEANRRTTPGTMTYQNNLSVINENFYDQAGGQQGIAFNGPIDTHIDSGQTVTFRSNTILGNPDIMFDIHESRIRFGIGVAKLYQSVTKFENNLIGTLNSVSSANSSQPHQHANNFQTFSADLLYGQSYPSTDTINLVGPGVDQDAWMTYSTLQPTGAATTGASDGAAVGIRWNSIPTLTQLLAADKTWATTYSAAAVPVASTTEDAWFQNIAP